MQAQYTKLRTHDKSLTVCYEIAAMVMMEDWRERLLAAVDADPRSDRAISLKAGLGANFVNQLRNSATEPGIKKVLRLAAELNVSLAALFYGQDTTPEDEEFLSLLKSASAGEREGLLALLRARRSSKN